MKTTLSQQESILKQMIISVLENIIFKSPRKNDYPESDREIVISAGKYMLGMIRKSASSKQYPNGQLDKMPPAINYIHGGVQYNGGFLYLMTLQMQLTTLPIKILEKVS